MKMKFGHISTILFIIGIFSMVSGKEKIFCNQCENLIKEGASYIVSNGKIYCGDKCLSATWEKCSVCKKRVSKGIHYGNKNGVFFCLECSGKPLCFACGLPNDCSVLKDGRMICAKCEAKSISSFREAMNIIRDVRKKMKE
ncbi:MAG: hypothetical protein L6407_06105, partial [Candidatus Delongbacteria bacterium]|nr:hypothetical protein [Candidatus Delongbacteria bacterium]